jgi:glycosyltransferase involved in cell wall biosynthesis
VRPLTVLHCLAPGTVGGLESVVHALAAGRRQAGGRVGVAAVLAGPRPSIGAHAFLDGLEAAGVDTFVASIPGRGYRRERAFVIDTCTTFRPDIVHTHGLRPDIIDAAAARHLGLPTVSTVHGLTHAGWRKGVYEYLEFRALRRADAVVPVSRPLVGVLQRAGVDPDRLRLIPNAFLPTTTPRLTRDEARVALGIDADAFTVGWVGRLSREKGADVLLDALGTIDARAVIIGAGREETALRAQAARLGLGDRVRWAGAVPSAAALMPAFDALVLSSRTEGTPIVLFEAMAALVPIIAADVGGVPDVVRSTDALLVPPERPDELARAICAVRDDRTAARIRAAAAGERLAAVYDPAPWLDRYEAVYEAVYDAARQAASDPVRSAVVR